MTHTCYTYESHNLGDQLIFLHLLRSLAKAHVSRAFLHFCNGCHLSQLREVVADLPNILLEPFESPLWQANKRDAVNVWKNAESHWERSQNRWDWAAHTLEHHAWTARRMGFESPFTCREHLLFDYPALAPQPWEFSCTFLIGDSPPNSGQFLEWADHSKNPMEALMKELSKRHVVTRTSQLKELGYSVSEVGKYSHQCRHHIMVANAPFFCTLNTHNHHNHEGRKRIVLLDNGEQLNMPHITQCARVEEVMEIAKGEGWL